VVCASLGCKAHLAFYLNSVVVFFQTGEMTSFNLQSSCVKIMRFGLQNLFVCWKLNDLKKNPWDAGDDLVHTNLPHGEHNIKDEEEKFCK